MQQISRCSRSVCDDSPAACCPGSAAVAGRRGAPRRAGSGRPSAQQGTTRRRGHWRRVGAQSVTDTQTCKTRRGDGKWQDMRRCVIDSELRKSLFAVDVSLGRGPMGGASQKQSTSKAARKQNDRVSSCELCWKKAGTHQTDSGTAPRIARMSTCRCCGR